MIALPAHPHRIWLRSFWLALSVVTVVPLGVAAAVFDISAGLAAGPVAVLLGMGLARPDWVRAPYRVWTRAARLYARLAEALILRVAFYTVLVPARWSGAVMSVARPPAGASLWTPRALTPLSMAGSQGWMGRYAAWGGDAGRRWALALLPFLLLLSTLKTADEAAVVPDNIYTLY